MLRMGPRPAQPAIPFHPYSHMQMQKSALWQSVVSQDEQTPKGNDATVVVSMKTVLEHGWTLLSVWFFLYPILRPSPVRCRPMRAYTPCLSPACTDRSV